MYKFEDEYTTGIEEIDDQHKLLFIMAESFDTEIIRGKYGCKEIVEYNLPLFKKSLMNHLDYELNFLKNALDHRDNIIESNKKYLSNHEKDHEKLKSYFNDIENETDPLKQLSMIENIMIKYLIEHIIQYDQQIKDFLKSI